MILFCMENIDHFLRIMFKGWLIQTTASAPKESVQF